MKILTGIAASDGISIGKCHILDREKLSVRKYNIPADRVDEEISKLHDAVDKTAEFIETSKKMSLDAINENQAFIFDIYLMLLRDNMLLGEAETIIRTRRENAEHALAAACRMYTARFDKSKSEYLRERKADIENIVQKVLRFMTGGGPESILYVDDAEIIIAHDLSPADTSHMNRKDIKGFATDLGSRTSHTSILARSLGIPAVVGIGDITLAAESGDNIIIDGFEGIVIVDPDEETFTRYQQKDTRYTEYFRELARLKDEDTVTLDGVRIELYSNIEMNHELYLSREYNSDGVGLYRTEYMYMQHGDVDEEYQYNVLKEAAKANNGKPLVIRTFDLGADKLSKYMPHPKEQNPAMGLRAIRYSLKYKDFFIKQLRAILRVSAEADVRIMFPMISGMEELNRCKKVVEYVKKQLDEEGIVYNKNIKTGVMMELPSLAVLSDIVAHETDFFSVGTNDLIQYSLGIDRNNEYVAYLYMPSHPAVCALLKRIVDGADKAGIECTVCGEMAAEPKYIPLLLGMGYRRLSMSPLSILKARMMIRSLKVSDCVELVKGFEQHKLASETENALLKFIQTKYSDIYFH